MASFLPYGKQWLNEADRTAVARVLGSDWLTTGPEVEAFERELAAFTGARYAVAVNSGTAALHAAYFAAGVGPGDEVLTSPITFAATANAARFLGAGVVFADVRPDTVNLDPEAAARAITPRTRAIVPVDFTGHPADMEEFRRLAGERGAVLISDACHSLGATYKGRRVGTLADLTVFSFHPVKGITTGEGGAVVTDNPDYYERLLAFRSHGIVREPEKMRENHGPWYHEMQFLGYNYRLTDIQCALGRSQLARFPEFLRRRREIAAIYRQELAGIPGLTLPTVVDEVEPAWHLFVLRLDRGIYDRRHLFETLRERGLGVQVHYLPVYWHPYYQDLGYKKGLCPAAEAYYEECLSIPLYPAMTGEDVEHVVTTLRRVFEEARR